MTKEIRRRPIHILVLVLLFNLFIFSAIFESNTQRDTTVNTDVSRDIMENLDEPKSSSGELNIISPENKNYNNSMAGYYPATYGFDGDQTGDAQPTYFNNLYYTDCDGEVIDELDGHKKVMMVDDNTAFGAALVRQYFNDGPDKSSGHYLGSYSFENHSVGPISESNPLSVPPFENSVRAGTYIRAHIEGHSKVLEFNYDGGNDLAAVYRLSYNEIEHGTFEYYFRVNNTQTRYRLANLRRDTYQYEFGRIMLNDAAEGTIHVGESHHQFSMALEPFVWYRATVSWSGNGGYLGLGAQDARYNITNMETGEFESYMDNYGDFKTEDGCHMVSFNVLEDGNGNTPGKLWLDALGENVHDYYPNDYQMGDNLIEAGALNQNQTHGTVEFYRRTTTAAYNTGTRLNYGSGIDETALNIGTDEGDWLYTDDTGTHVIPNVGTPQTNHWYHVRLDFRCDGAPVYQSLGENQYRITIDGIDGGTHNFLTNCTEIMMFMALYTAQGTYTGHNAYCDAIGYSWDPDYEIGDNLNEGLLLSYENTTNLDWQGYSLDGQANVTIQGNTTIPMPEDGTHIIQVFGNDTSGNIIRSDLVEFTIDSGDLTAPSITVNETKHYLKQNEGCWIGWNVSDPANGNYTVFLNGTGIANNSFIGSCEFSTFIYSDQVGFLNVTLIAEDEYGNLAQKIIIVEVYSSNYEYIEGSEVVVLNIISQKGLYLEIETSGPAFLQITHSSNSEDFSDIQTNIWANLTALQFYSFELLDINYEKDSSLLESATIRFYYAQIANNINDPSNLRLLHGLYSGEYIKVWNKVDLSLNENGNYVEVTVSSFSYYCLAEVEVDSESGLLIFFMDNLLLIIILASVGVAVPTLYTVRSKQQKKKKSAETLKSKEKLSKDTIKHDLKRKAETKRRQLERTWEPVDLTEQKEQSSASESTRSETISLDTRNRPVTPKKKVKKSKAIAQKPLSKREKERIKKELQETEKDVTIQERKDNCVVHKGPIRGINYICPECGGKYCLKCAKLLSKRRETCWVCKNPIDIEFGDNKNTRDDFFDNEKIEKIFSEASDIEELQVNYGNINLTALSEDFWKKVNSLEWDEGDKMEFIKEMLALKPKQRQAILQKIIDKNKSN